MERSFSPELITRAQRIFEKRSGRPVSEDETEIYLERLSRLGLIAVEILKQTRKEVKEYGELKKPQ